MDKQKEEKNPLEGKNPLDGVIEKINEVFGGKMYIPIAIGVVIIILLIVIILGAISGRNSNDGENVSPGMLTAAIVSAEDRFAYHDESGQLVGIEPGLAQSLAEAEGLTLKIIEVADITEAVSLVDTKAADVAFGRITSQVGDAGYNVSVDYGHSGLFMVTALHDYTDSLKLMTGYSVGVMGNVKDVASSLSGYEYVSLKDYDNAITLGEDISSRTISLGIVNERDAIKLAKSFPNALQVQEISDNAAEYYVAVFPNGKSVSVTILNGIINSYGSDGE